MDIAEIRWLAIAAAAAIGVPLTAITNAWEYWTSGRVLGQRIAATTALRITLLASAINYLPAHGGALLRVQHLHQGGSRYRHATSVTAVMGVAWLGLAGLLAGVWLAPGGHGRLYAAIAAVMGSCGLVIAYALLRLHLKEGTRRRQLARTILVVELSSILSVALRYFLVLYALDLFDGSMHTALSAAMLFALASVIASATGLVPGGLGFRELLASVFAPIVGLPAAAGFAVTAVDRVISLVVNGMLALVLLRNVGTAAEGTIVAAEGDATAIH